MPALVKGLALNINYDFGQKKVRGAGPWHLYSYIYGFLYWNTLKI